MEENNLKGNNIQNGIETLVDKAKGTTYSIVKVGKVKNNVQLYKYLIVDWVEMKNSSIIKIKMLGTELGVKTDNDKIAKSKSGNSIATKEEAKKELVKLLGKLESDLNYLEVIQIIEREKRTSSSEIKEIRKRVRETIPMVCLSGYFTKEDESKPVEVEVPRVEIGYTEQKDNQLGLDSNSLTEKVCNMNDASINLEKSVDVDGSNNIEIGKPFEINEDSKDKIEEQSKDGNTISNFFNKMKDKVEELVDCVEESLDDVVNGILVQSDDLATDAEKQLSESVNELVQDVNNALDLKKSDSNIVDGEATEVFVVNEDDIMSDDEVLKEFGIDAEGLLDRTDKPEENINSDEINHDIKPNFNVAIPSIDLSNAILEYGKKAEDKRVENKEFNKLGSGCNRCNFTGKVKDPLTGIVAICECQHREEIKQRKEKEEQEKFEAKQLQLQIEDRELFELLIPEERRDGELRVDLVRSHISTMAESQGVKVRNFGAYADGLENILTSIAYGKLNRSYIIGAPNGYGKETMVYTAMKLLLAQKKKVVPYKSLVELAGIKADYEQNLLRQFRGGGTKQSKQERFTWTDYLEADVLFTYLSAVSSKELESDVLYSILSIRAKNGLPTIVMVSFSLDAYVKDPKLRKYYWDDMLAYKVKEGESSLDRLIHISCYKLYKTDDFKAVRGIDY